MNHADIFFQQSDFEKARSYVRKGLNIYEQFNIAHGAARCHLILAKVEYAVGAIDKAKAEAESAYQIYSKLKSQHRMKETEKLLERINIKL